MRRLLIPLLPLLALAACATPESRIRTELVRAGVPDRYADCMAGRLVDRLSTAELRRLAKLPRLREEEIRSMSIDRLLARLRQVGDPHVVSVITTAGLGCAIAS